ncbi:Icc-related predicted phosphoesterase [Roseimicrobium gellanilyticum]|uniref:Icc-related predicted phosphoesterase n=1 Tax=Roseimicrobium gellanilyticum TaxID=748857 RepID=A0A366HN50_9BACT|nr:metallophosphoesterase [Roseimicrobium gellanilyticum]RBP43752.1 Icc-related predicted phosphoesterase [Roseimicrobium gellanilyticum]
MRIHILSDLHQEFGEVDVPEVSCDLVILAGDVSTKLNGLTWIRKRFPSMPVIYLCGNHEFYGEKLPRVTEKLRLECEGTNVHYLENDAVELGGYWFYGCTLWTDLALHGDWHVGAGEAGELMNDYKRVRNSEKSYRHLTPQDTRALHLHSVEAMGEFLEGHDPSRTVVVTHHAPSMCSLPEHRRSKLLSCAYASHLDDFILKHEPLLWIHGHIHHSCDYHIGQTRVVANPRAYPDGPNVWFNPALVMDLEMLKAERARARG